MRVEPPPRRSSRHELADGRLQLAAEIRLDPERPGLSLLDLRRLNKEFHLGARRKSQRRPSSSPVSTLMPRL